MSNELCDFDIVIIGAGISAINFAYYVQKEFPQKKFCFLERRNELGGTWSFFKYPGVRSDSDLFTYSFSWKPWKKKNTIARASLIREYLEEAVAEQGFHNKIQYETRVISIQWSSTLRLWEIFAEKANEVQIRLKTRFVYFGTGYFSYDEPLETVIPGLETFRGDVIHPQFWPDNLDYTDKTVVIIGSGATAVTLVPAMVEKAKQVTMLQRSPTWIISLPSSGTPEYVIRHLLPERLAHRALRWTWRVVICQIAYTCRRWPSLWRTYLLRKTKQQTPRGANIERDFTPSYNPWDQRLCLSPDGDFFKALHTGKAHVKTDTIQTVTTNSIKLTSGIELHPDLIVTATGLKMDLVGGIKILIDGRPYEISESYAWQNAMLENLPNAVFTMGYLDTGTWTLGAEVAAMLACRLLKKAYAKGFSMFYPQRTAEAKLAADMCILRLNSTYIKQASTALPNAVDIREWRPRRDFKYDMKLAKDSDLARYVIWRE